MKLCISKQVEKGISINYRQALCHTRVAGDVPKLEFLEHLRRSKHAKSYWLWKRLLCLCGDVEGIDAEGIDVNERMVDLQPPD